MQRKNEFRLLLCAQMLALSGSACSAESGEVPGREPSFVLPTAESVEADFQRKRQETLSVEERRSLLAFLANSGVASDEIAIEGRLVVLGDAYADADELLANIEQESVVTKGKVLTTTIPGSPIPGCVGLSCPRIAPFQFAMPLSPQNGQPRLAFRRPDTTRTYYVVVNDLAPAFFTSGTGGGLIGRAVTQLVNAVPNDCITTSTLRVMRAAEYRNLTTVEKQGGYFIDVTFGAFNSVCSGAANACANFPQQEGVLLAPGVVVNRLRFGTRIGVVTIPILNPSTAITETTTQNIGTITHELMHALGFAHPEPGQGGTTIPGTQGGTSHVSIMYATPNELLSNTLSNDDKAALTKLYSGNCTYSEQFRTITP